MRSSGRTIVSRTRERIDSLRRSLRGRLVRAGAVLSVRFMVFVVIGLSCEIVGTGAVGRTELAPVTLVRAVGAEVLLADRARFEMAGVLSRPTRLANPVMDLGHRSKYPVFRTVKSNPGRSLTVATGDPTIPVPPRTWRCSSDG